MRRRRVFANGASRISRTARSICDHVLSTEASGGSSAGPDSCSARTCSARNAVEPIFRLEPFETTVHSSSPMAPPSRCGSHVRTEPFGLTSAGRAVGCAPPHARPAPLALKKREGGRFLAEQADFQRFRLGVEFMSTAPTARPSQISPGWRAGRCPTERHARDGESRRAGVDAGDVHVGDVVRRGHIARARYATRPFPRRFVGPPGPLDGAKTRGHPILGRPRVAARRRDALRVAARSAPSPRTARVASLTSSARASRPPAPRRQHYKWNLDRAVDPFFDGSWQNALVDASEAKALAESGASHPLIARLPPRAACRTSRATTTPTTCPRRPGSRTGTGTRERTTTATSTTTTSRTRCSPPPSMKAH